jgi:hypothetical protein
VTAFVDGAPDGASPVGTIGELNEDVTHLQVSSSGETSHLGTGIRRVAVCRVRFGRVAGHGMYFTTGAISEHSLQQKAICGAVPRIAILRCDTCCDARCDAMRCAEWRAVTGDRLSVPVRWRPSRSQFSLMVESRDGASAVCALSLPVASSTREGLWRLSPFGQQSDAVG